MKRINTILLGLSHRDPARHAALRRTIGQSFGSRAIAEFEPTVKRCILNYLDKLSERSKEVVDLNDWNNRLAFDVTSEQVYANRIGNIESGLCAKLWWVGK